MCRAPHWPPRERLVLGRRVKQVRTAGYEFTTARQSTQSLKCPAAAPRNGGAAPVDWRVPCCETDAE
jgi:hypothetical protein